jgi:hypothetical protein
MCIQLRALLIAGILFLSFRRLQQSVTIAVSYNERPTDVFRLHNNEIYEMFITLLLLIAVNKISFTQ